MKNALLLGAALACGMAVVASASDAGSPPGLILEGKRLFEEATFGGNGRSCRTCHSAGTGTLSAADAEKRFQQDSNDPLFVHDGSDDFLGNGTTRIRTDATVLIKIPLAANVSLLEDPSARTVTVRRAVATTLNSPALDEQIMLDGRQPNLESQAAGAIMDHAQGVVPTFASLHAIAEFQKTNAFFTSPEVRRFALEAGPPPPLPAGNTPSEKRGRRFFEDVPPDPAAGFKPGLCAHCHSGPLLNKTNEFADDFIGLPIPAGQRFANVLVSEFNAAQNPLHTFVFNKGTPQEAVIQSPDLGRAMFTGQLEAPVPLLDQVNSFKISPLRGIKLTAPYFHDNSAKTLEDVAAHYARFFAFVTGGGLVLTPQDQADIVAYMKLLK